MQLVHVLSAVLRIGFELKLVVGTVVSILIGLALYRRGARTKQAEP